MSTLLMLLTCLHAPVHDPLHRPNDEEVDAGLSYPSPPTQRGLWMDAALQEFPQWGFPPHLVHMESCLLCVCMCVCVRVQCAVKTLLCNGFVFTLERLSWASFEFLSLCAACCANFVWARPKIRKGRWRCGLPCV
eukprot:4561590-Amphidinium_carterae.1